MGAATLLAAWLFGSVALIPVGVGLVAAGLVALAWRGLAPAGVALDRDAPVRLTEGEPLRLGFRVRRSRLLAGRARVVERIGTLGEREVAIERGCGALVVPAIPRGVYRLGPTVLEIEDPFGLERVTMDVAEPGSIWVRPRVVEIDRLFADGATSTSGIDGRPRPTSGGHEPAGIRGYREGEPLRSVHWASTARRGELMVRELDDPSRDHVVVVLDGHHAGDVGPRGDSSFDEAVRVAAAVVKATTRAGRRTRLVVHGATTASYRAGGAPAEWDALLDGLAAAQADARGPVHGLLADRTGVTRGVDDAIVVTALPSVSVARVLSRVRRGALVVIDAPTYAGRPTSSVDPVVLRAAAGGVAVAIVRHGDDLSSVLSARARERIGA
jgi:uncharacterized protein (DUF58 family)